MRRRNFDRLVGECQCGSRVATQLSQLCREQERQTDAIGIFELLRMSYRLSHRLVGPIGVTKHPVREGTEISADGPGILVVGGCARAEMIGVVERHALTAVVTHVDEVALPPRRVGHHRVADRRYERISLRRSQFQEFVCQRARLSHAPAHDLCVGQAGKGREQFWSPTNLSRKLSCPCIYRLDGLRSPHKAHGWAEH